VHGWDGRMSVDITIPRRLLEDLIDEDDCWFDHNGGCQAHMYLSLRPGELCPQEEAKRVLDPYREAREMTQ
jgi:hypothetical protein